MLGARQFFSRENKFFYSVFFNILEVSRQIQKTDKYLSRQFHKQKDFHVQPKYFSLNLEQKKGNIQMKTYKS